jgi:hypothetical protein
VIVQVTAADVAEFRLGCGGIGGEMDQVDIAAVASAGKPGKDAHTPFECPR